MSISTMKKMVFFFVLSAILIAIAGAAFIYWHSTGVSQDIDLEISPRHEEMSYGVPTMMDISIGNGTNKTINNVSLFITLEGALVGADSEDARRIVKEVGSISSGEVVKEEINVLPVLEDGDGGRIEALVSYSLGGVDFELREEKSISTEKSALDVNVGIPDQIMGSVPFETVLRYENKTDFDIPSLFMQIDYPSSFRFISSNPTPTSLNNRWDINGLTAGTSGEIRIMGVLENDQRPSELGVDFITDISGGSYSIDKHATVLSTAEPPVDLNVSRRGRPAPGGTLRYTIDYKNRSGVALKNNKIELSLEGVMVEPDSIKSTGSPTTSDKTLTWNFEDNAELEILEPTDEGSFTAVVELKDSFSIERLSDKNFTINASAVFESPSVPYYLGADQTKVTANEVTNVEGLAEVDARAFFRDPDSGFVNKGSVPPKVGETTQYTVHWEITSYSTDLTDVKLESQLPEHVNWTGKVQSNIDSAPLYNEESRRIVWDIEEVSAATGVLMPVVEGIFQVEITPTEEMVGSPQIILDPTTLMATDVFTGTRLTDEDGPLSTLLRDDPTVDTEDGVVVD